MIEKLMEIDQGRLLNRVSLDIDNKVVLVDFWTYTCVNCLRTLPSLKSIYNEFRNYGFEIIGVHTPEFSFEKDPENIRRAIRELEIDYPVVNDYDYAVWNEFENRYWPAHYLFDKEGKLVHTHFGEGGYEELSEIVSSLLSINKRPKVDEDPAYYFGTTPETYLGNLRGEIANGPTCYNSKCNYYVLPRRTSIGRVFLEGYWDVNEEFITPDDEFAKLHFTFRGKEINAVIDPSGNNMIDYSIDGVEMKKNLDYSRMYNLYTGNEVREHTIIIKAPRGVKLYVFTFG